MSANCMKAKMLSAALFAALVLSAMQSVRAEEATYNYWVGDSGNSWNDKDSGTGKYKWTTGELPTATETAAFKKGTQIVKIKDKQCLAAKVVFESDSVITFSRLDSGTADEVTAGEFSGEGTLKLFRTGLQAAYAGCTVSVAGFEVLYDSSYPSNYSWLDGGTAESEKMVVESAVTGRGNLACNNYVEVNGDVTLTGFLKLSANATVKNLVYNNGGCKIASDSAGGTIEKVTVKSGTLEYSSSTLKSVSAITVGKFVLDGGTVDIGDGSSIEDGGLEIGVLSGGYLRYTVSEIPETGVPDFPEGLTFAAAADLSNVFAIVKNNSGDTHKAYAITKTGEAYSFAELVPTDTVKWIGGIDNNWATAGNWIYGAVPTEGQMVVFDNNASVIIGADVTADITITSGSRVSFRSSDIGYVHPNIFTTTVTGGGRVALEHVGLRAISNKNSTVDVSELEIVNCGNDSWLQGVDENNPLTVSSAIVGNGKLCVYSYVLFNGDNSKFAGNWEMGNKWGSTGRARFASGNSGFSACSSSACYGDSRIYLDTDEEVVFASLTLPSGNDRIVVTVPDATLTACAESNDIELSGNVVLQGEGSSLTVRKIGAGTLKTGLAGVYSLNVEQGRVEFRTDNSDVSVCVSSCASIGSTADVTIGAVTFENGAKVMQTVTKTADEVEEGADQTYTYAVPTLTLTGNYDISGVVFGVTNPVDLPAATLGATPFTMLTATGTLNGKPTTDVVYKPEGSASGMRWVAAKSDNSVTLKAVPSGMMVIVY